MRSTFRLTVIACVTQQMHSIVSGDCHATFVMTPDTVLQGRNRMILCFCGVPHGMSRRSLLATATAALLLPARSHAATASAGPADPALLADLVTANHILFDQAVVDGFGHVSVRHNNDPTHFLMARSMAPALVTAADIIEYDSNSEPIDASGRASYIERYIHGEIYRVRPDVRAVVHSHSQAVIPFANTTIALRPMNHIAAFLGTGAPVFDIRGVGGDGTDMLIRNNALGKALAQTLGQHTVALMRGHGSVAVGPTLKHVVYRAVYTEVNARMEAEALSMGGKPEFLSPREAAAATKTTDKLVERPWELWKRHEEQAR
jgi:ribulose-5-phosphate 4-epimerase/fuculose-1-phosphate aldolase